MTDFPLTTDDAVDLARTIVLQRFPDARAAWLGGSVIRGDATATSDLDVTVLLAGPPAPFRESLVAGCRGHSIPIELFVQTRESLASFRRKDQARRQPSTARLIAEAKLLLGEDEFAREVIGECVDEIARGPNQLSSGELEAARYVLSDQLDDLADADTAQLRAVVGAQVWENAARLLLGVEGRWQGTGKGLFRELLRRDTETGGGEAASLNAGLVGVAADSAALIAAAEAVLAAAGGRYWAGYRVGGPSVQ